MKSKLTMGVIGTSFKENERRAPIHPAHLDGIAAGLRQRMTFEYGYGERFGMRDEQLAARVGGLATREQIFERADIVLLPKPTEADFPFFREGQVLWGWPHCVQGPAITQLAIDRRLTYLAWEAMFAWRAGVRDLHTFHVNNQLAGYCSVLHALQCMGITGAYGPYKRAAVIGFGATGRGALHALRGMDYRDLTLLTQRPPAACAANIPGVRHLQYRTLDGGGTLVAAEGGERTMAAFLGDFDIVVNCVLQDTDRPQMFVAADEVATLRDGTLIVDVSCDLAMGFHFARPTSFETPMFDVDGGRIQAYAVDHSPSWLWNSATHEISQALLPHLEAVLAGPAAWHADATLAKAIEIEAGVVRNPKILSFRTAGPIGHTPGGDPATRTGYGGAHLVGDPEEEAPCGSWLSVLASPRAF